MIQKTELKLSPVLTFSEDNEITVAGFLFFQAAFLSHGFIVREIAEALDDTCRNVYYYLQEARRIAWEYRECCCS